MKIPINKSQKAELLKAIKAGEFDTSLFPELEKALNKDELKELIDQGIIDQRDELCRNTKY